MTRKKALGELIAKIEDGNERYPLSWSNGGYLTGGLFDLRSEVNRAHNGSLDAAKALHETVLPGWGWRIGQCHVSDDAWVSAPDDSMAPDGQEWSAYTDIDQRPPGNPARAWLLSMLKALHAMEPDE